MGQFLLPDEHCLNNWMISLNWWSEGCRSAIIDRDYHLFMEMKGMQAQYLLLQQDKKWEYFAFLCNTFWDLL